MNRKAGNKNEMTEAVNPPPKTHRSILRRPSGTINPIDTLYCRARANVKKRAQASKAQAIWCMLSP
jgi:hypothetical protein